jgi:serine-type D-Ala-D-Ala carboxypeptidase/endopeptidase
MPARPPAPTTSGRHLLDPESPLLAQAAPTARVEITVDPKIYDGYVGRYQLAPAAILTVTKTDNHLFAQLTGQPRVEMFATSETEFFLKAVAAQLTFDVDGQGRATAVTLHQNGRNPRAPRIE